MTMTMTETIMTTITVRKILVGQIVTDRESGRKVTMKVTETVTGKVTVTYSDNDKKKIVMTVGITINEINELHMLTHRSQHLN